MKVACKACDFSGAIVKGAAARVKIRTAIALRVREDCKPFVPKVSGNLRGTAETQSSPEDGRIVWGGTQEVPYAAYQYYTAPHKTYPGTCCEWFVSAEAAHKKEWEKTAQMAAKEVFGR